MAIVPGAAFGDDKYIRFSYATNEDNLREALKPVSYTHLRAHETVLDLVCRLLLEQKTDTS